MLEKNNKVYFIVFLSICILIALVFLTMGDEGKEKNTDRWEDSIKVMKREILDYKVRIDSLQINIHEQEKEIDSLKNRKVSIEKEKIIEVDRVKKLPTTSGVEYLKEKIKDYEKETEK